MSYNSVHCVSLLSYLRRSSNFAGIEVWLLVTSNPRGSCFVEAVVVFHTSFVSIFSRRWILVAATVGRVSLVAPWSGWSLLSVSR